MARRAYCSACFAFSHFQGITCHSGDFHRKAPATLEKSSVQIGPASQTSGFQRESPASGPRSRGLSAITTHADMNRPSAALWS